MTTCELHVPLPADVDPAEARLLLAIGLFREEKVRLGKGAEMAGLNKRDFVEQLVKRGIPWMTYTEEMLAQDMKFVDEWRRR